MCCCVYTAYLELGSSALSRKHCAVYAVVYVLYMPAARANLQILTAAPDISSIAESYRGCG